MSTPQSRNKQVVSRIIEEAINGGDFRCLDALFSDTLVEHDPHQSANDSPLESFKEAVTLFRNAFPDQKTVIDAQIAEGDLVATRWHMIGTHLGAFMGIPPSGNRVELSGIFFDRLEGGRLRETWANYDLYGLMQQISTRPTDF
jgi:steroid delta-isomerase-like uncharacterized protein